MSRNERHGLALIYALLGVALILFILAIEGCSSPPQGQAPSTGPLQQIGQFTLADLHNADEIAVANGDMIAHACYPALATFVDSVTATSTPQTVSGAISAFETARTQRLKLESGIVNGLPAYLKLGCSALVMDEQTLLVKLGALSAGAVAVGPALLGVP